MYTVRRRVGSRTKPVLQEQFTLGEGFFYTTYRERGLPVDSEAPRKTVSDLVSKVTGFVGSGHPNDLNRR